MNCGEKLTSINLLRSSVDGRSTVMVRKTKRSHQWPKRASQKNQARAPRSPNVSRVSRVKPVSLASQRKAAKDVANGHRARHVKNAKSQLAQSMST